MPRHMCHQNDHPVFSVKFTLDTAYAPKVTVTSWTACVPNVRIRKFYIKVPIFNYTLKVLHGKYEIKVKASNHFCRVNRRQNAPQQRRPS